MINKRYFKKHKPSFNKCLKCGIKKRRNTNMLCVTCSNAKNLIIDETLTINDIKLLVNEMYLFIQKLEIQQNSWIDLYDINDIITNHQKIFNKDYIGLSLMAGEQLSIMYNDIKKFVTCYDYFINQAL